MRLSVLWLLFGLTSAPLLAAQVLTEEVFATVDGEVISQQTFDTFLQVGKRQRFFHGDIPADEEAAFRKEVAQRLIDQSLLRAVVRERKISADPEWVAQQLASIEARYETRPHWQARREGFIAELRPQLEAQSQREQLEMQVRQAGDTGDAAVLAYYTANPEKFTTPERLRVSLILLGVEPWAKPPQWQAAVDEAQGIIERLQAGDDDFAALARLRSSDSSGMKGGDLGYVHQGMLAKEAQQVIDGLKPGEVSAPIRLLKGIAIFRVEERVEPVLNPFEQVKSRAQALYAREKSDKNWQAFIGKLRSSADVKVRDPQLLPASSE